MITLADLTDYDFQYYNNFWGNNLSRCKASWFSQGREVGRIDAGLKIT